jgi:hypothetical protein
MTMPIVTSELSDVAPAPSPVALNRIIYQVVYDDGVTLKTSPPALIDPGRDLTVRDAILECAKFDKPLAVHRINLTTGEVTPASFEVALAWWKILAAEGVDPDGRVPAFIKARLTRDQMWAEIVEG